LDAALERAAGGRRFVEADENSAHGPSLRGEPCRDLAEERGHPDVLVNEVLEHRPLDADGFVVAQTRSDLVHRPANRRLVLAPRDPPPRSDPLAVLACAADARATHI